MINKISNKTKHYMDVFFLLLAVTGVVLAIALTYVYMGARKQNDIAMKILDIKNLSSDISSELSNEFGIANADLINQSLIKIEQSLAEIESSGEYFSIFLDDDVAKSYDALKVALQSQSASVNEFLTYKAIIAEAMLDLSANLRYTTEIRTLAGFYSRILLSRFGDIFDPYLFADDISKKRLQIIQENKGASIDYDYLTKLGRLNEQFILLNETIQRTKQMNIFKKVDDVLVALEGFNNKLEVIVNLIAYFFFAMVVLFLAKIFFEKKLFAQMLKKAKQIDYIIENTDSTLLTINTKGIITQIQNRYISQLNDPVGTKLEIYGQNGYKIDIIADLKNEINKENGIKYNFTTRINSKKFEVYEKVFARAIYDKMGDLSGAEVLFVDFSSEYLANFKLEHISKKLEHNYTTDKETGLPNHLALSEALKSNQRAYLIYISIEQFENIQFFYNEKTVLLILTQVSKTIELCLESFKFHVKFYRIQDDKFCILSSEERHPSFLVKQLFNYFSSTITMPDDKNHDITLNVNLCIGVSLDIDTQNTDRLTQAKLAHQSAKEHEESVFYYEQNDENERVYRQNQIISRLIRNALNGGGVTVECQPLFDLNKPIDKSFEIFSYEILVRILDEQGKMRYPGEFLGVAKHAGLYLSITKAVIIKAFELAKRFDYRFSVNLSSTDMTNPGIIELFKNGLEECRNPEHITIEVLETESVEQDLNEVRAFLDMVRSKGCHVAIDDFGSGYANIAIILQLDIDYIKIDGSVIQRLPFDPDSREFLRMLANFANVTGYTMVAEFVSNQEILDQVRALGVQYAQGYLLGKPISLM